LTIPIGIPLLLEQAAEAHDRTDSGRILVGILD
jgi:hypothetical protein